MCGRYATTRSDADLSLLFDAVAVAEELGPSWNVAPTDPVPVVRVSQRHGGRVLDHAKWGLIPSWSSDHRAGARMINARAETVATSPAFAPSFARRRCLVPADGWFEWVRDGGRKQPFYMTPVDGSALAFAGLWSMSGASVLTSSIVTTEAVGELAAVHNRMPLILPAARWPEWLAGGGEPTSLLRPMTAAELSFIEIRPVGPKVGNVRNNGPELIGPSMQEQEIGTLF
jgi:putative SOS response-associated peptidase YedK